MWYARERDSGQSVRANPGIQAVCPGCGEQVIAKCGELVTWHFAHRSNHDCDRWSEPESEWHQGWKRLAPVERCEVVIGPHRADIVSPTGTVVELQHSSISTQEIRERETFYRDMVWLFDLRECEDRIEERRNGFFIWKHARQSVLSATKPLYFDLGDAGSDILCIRKVLPPKEKTWEFNGEVFHDGWLPRAFLGTWIPEQAFIERYIADPAVIPQNEPQLGLFDSPGEARSG